MKGWKRNDLFSAFGRNERERKRVFMWYYLDLSVHMTLIARCRAKYENCPNKTNLLDCCTCKQIVKGGWGCDTYQNLPLRWVGLAVSKITL